jgi:hypothetical protein
MIVEPTKSFWKDTTCCSTTIVDQKKVAPLCQHDRMCPGGAKPFEGRCYLLVGTSRTWANAEQDCKNKGGHLASVHSEEENTFIFNLPSGSRTQLWIGGTDAAIEVLTHIQNTYFIHIQGSRSLEQLLKAGVVFCSLKTNYKIKIKIFLKTYFSPTYPFINQKIFIIESVIISFLEHF